MRARNIKEFGELAEEDAQTERCQSSHRTSDARCCFSTRKKEIQSSIRLRDTIPAWSFACVRKEIILAVTSVKSSWSSIANELTCCAQSFPKRISSYMRWIRARAMSCSAKRTSRLQVLHIT